MGIAATFGIHHLPFRHMVYLHYKQSLPAYKIGQFAEECRTLLNGESNSHIIQHIGEELFMATELDQWFIHRGVKPNETVLLEF